jgi:hypothetical protein
VSRGGRRRKGKKGRRGPANPERRQGSGQEALEERESQPSGRRRGSSRGGGTHRETSVLESMSSLPTSLITLPPDGTDLDELIGALQSEYGVPATPQEYRLIIKVPAAEEPHTDPSIEVKPAAPAVEPEPEAAAVPRQRPSRRRRRGRRRSGGAEGDVDPVGGEGPDFEVIEAEGLAEPEAQP